MRAKNCFVPLKIGKIRQGGREAEEIKSLARDEGRERKKRRERKGRKICLQTFPEKLFSKFMIVRQNC
jgi:hypothetical protein